MFRRNTGLWVIQGLLAALFLFAGGMKLVLALEALKGPFELPGWFLRFIGVAEVTGAIGLIVPWLTGIRRALTPLASAGLVVIMIGATVLTAARVSVEQALLPALVGALALTVAIGRWSGRRATDAGRRAGAGQARRATASPNRSISPASL